VNIKPGDRIELVAMPDDPYPIPVGTRGTVEAVHPMRMDVPGQVQLWVKWDNGRSLMPIVPPDQVRVVEGGNAIASS